MTWGWQNPLALLQANGPNFTSLRGFLQVISSESTRGIELYDLYFVRSGSPVGLILVIVISLKMEILVFVFQRLCFHRISMLFAH